MEKTSSTRPELAHLTGIRIIAALWVVLFHASFQIEVLLPEAGGLWFMAHAGYMAVDLFFVLSGFIISYTYLDEFAGGMGRYGLFIWKRLARIYPVHIATLLAFVAVFIGANMLGVSIGSPETFTVWGAVQDVLLIRVWVGDDLGWNYPAWSLSAEWLSYLLFPLIVVAVSAVARVGRAALIGAGVGLLGAGALFAAVLPSINGMPWPAVRVLIGFTIGCVIFSLTRATAVTASRGWAGVACLLALLFVIPAVPPGPLRVAVGLLLDSATIYFLARGSGAAVSVLGCRVLAYGGRISFSVYMVHSMALLLLALAFAGEQWAEASLPVRVAIVASHLVLPLLAGAATYHLVEKPAHKWLSEGIRKPARDKHANLPDTHQGRAPAEAERS